MQFKVGDKVRKEDRTAFHTGLFTATILEIDSSPNAIYPYRIDGSRWSTGINLVLVTVEVTSPDTKEASQALKSDSGKLQWELLLQGCKDAVRGVVTVLTVAVTPKDKGGRGYAPHSWKLVPDAETRYKDALFRHIDKVRSGEVWDDGPEGTGQLHWDCIATNALFLSQFEHEKNHARTVPTK